MTGGIAAAIAGNVFWRTQAFAEPQLSADCQTVTCFKDDYFEFGYATNVAEHYQRAQQGRLLHRASGRWLGPHVGAAFGSRRLYGMADGSVRNAPLKGVDYGLVLRLDLECGVPVIGTLVVPPDPIGVISIAHGSSTTPHRLFSRTRPDYMNSIGARLVDAGFAVWAPFMTNSGNMPSVYNIAALLAVNGISFANVLCSAIALGPEIVRSIHGQRLSFEARLGMSGGFYLMLYLAAAFDDCPVVVAG